MVEGPRIVPSIGTEIPAYGAPANKKKYVAVMYV